MIPPAFLTEIGGGVGSKSWQKRKKHVDIVDTSDARPRGLWVFGWISVTQRQKQYKQYNNPEVIVLIGYVSVLLAAPGARIGGGPPAAGGWSPCSWIIVVISCCCIKITLVLRL